MRKLLFAALFLIFTAPAAAQGYVDLSAFATTPQKPDLANISDRTYGGGVSATYVHMGLSSYASIQPVASLQYHRHTEADRDLSLSGGIRANVFGAYVQGTIGGVEKRNSMDMADRTVEVLYAGQAGILFSRIGAQATYFYSNFGQQYAAGLIFRF